MQQGTKWNFFYQNNCNEINELKQFALMIASKV